MYLQFWRRDSSESETIWNHQVIPSSQHGNWKSLNQKMEDFIEKSTKMVDVPALIFRGQCPSFRSSSSCPSVHPRHSPLGSSKYASADCSQLFKLHQSMDLRWNFQKTHEFSPPTTTLSRKISFFTTILGKAHAGDLVKSLVKSISTPGCCKD